MTARTEPDGSRETLICAVIFLIWACTLGSSQIDQLTVPVCQRRTNDSDEYSVEAEGTCNILEHTFYRLCDSSNITLVTDPVASVNSNSSVWTYVDTPVENVTFYYKICRFYPTPSGIFSGSELIDCTHNGTDLEVEVHWKDRGVSNISAFVFTSNNYSSFLGCARSSLIVAENKGLELHVSVHNEPTAASIQPAPFSPNDFEPSIPIDIDNLFKSAGSAGKYYITGNVTFACLTNRSDDTTYFKYDFGDGTNEPYTTDGNFTHTYEEAGEYDYRVDAIAIDDNSNKVNAFHTKHHGHISVLEPVSGISIKVNEGNQFQANVESQVNISAFGTRPIIACWYVALADYVVHHPVAPGPVDAKSTAPSPIQTCRLIINHSVWETMMFPDPGEFVFVANFYNNASQANGTISFKVFQSSPKAVVASTSTLIAVLAILIAVVSILMIVMGLYIPYRKYKTKFTETANFRFVELNESTQWDRVKMKVQEFADKISRNRKSSKVGLVNEQNESTRLVHLKSYHKVS